MRCFFFTEMPYPHISDEVVARYGSHRVTLPRHLMDPRAAADLYKQYLEMYEYADDVGIHLMLNEHHQTATCMNISLAVSTAAVIQRTRKGRILQLGYPLPHRQNPLQVAEEVAMLDCLSEGRLECGFVRGVPMEIHAANTNPVHNVERFREAHDLILKAWRSPDPFHWEGKHFQYRYVNLWPRCFQEPHPPLWVTGGESIENARWVADQGHRFAVFLTPYAQTEKMVSAYKERLVELGQPEAGPDQFGYLALVYVAETDEQASEEGRELLWYTMARNDLRFAAVPGYASVDAVLNRLVGKSSKMRTGSWEALMENGVVIAGSPDTVARQIGTLYERTGVGNLLMMGHAGAMPQARVLKSLKLFATEVLPQVAGLGVARDKAVAL